MPNLDMDAEVVSVLDRSLRTETDYPTVSLQEIAPRLIKPYKDERSSWGSKGFDIDKSKRDLEWLKSQFDIQYLLVVSPGFYYNQYKRPSNYYNYGYYCSSFLGLEESGVFVVGRLNLVDMSTLEIAAWHEYFSFKEIDDICAGKSYLNFAAEDRNRIGEALRALVAQSLPGTLERMNILSAAQTE